jgi:penicillin-binding protein-related factor A (putative recombinase)
MNSLNVNVNLDLYTNGDAEFKRVIGKLMINNLKEFQLAIIKCMQDHDIIPFKKTHHKCKPAIRFVENKDFIEVIEELSNLLETKPNDFTRLRVLEKSYQQWLTAIEVVISKFP